MLLCLSASKIYKTFSIFIRSRKKKLCICFISFLIHQSRSPGRMLLCLSACRIYNTFSISIRSRKKIIGGCSMSFLVRPSRSPLMMLLCLSASRIYNPFSISIRSSGKKIRWLFYVPFWFAHLEVLAWCYYAWALLGFITRLAFQSLSKKKH